MTKERYETSKAPTVTVVECAGDVVVRGWSENAVLVKGSHQAEASADEISIRSTGSMSITLPSRSHLALQSISGDAILKGLDSPSKVESVKGDLALKNLASLKIQAVYGDVSARNVESGLNIESVMGDLAGRNVGDLSAGAIHGDLSAQYVTGAVLVDDAKGDVNLHTVNGDVTLRKVRRDVNLNNLGGTLEIDLAEGDIRLKGSLPAGKHHCRARGDIVVRWPADAPLNLVVSHGSVQDKLGLQDVNEQEGAFSGRLGDGETTLVLEADGRVIIKEIEDADWSAKFGPEFAGMGAEFADIGVELAGLGEQLSSEFTAHMQELGARMEAKFGHDFAQTMAEKAAKRTERAVKRAMREAERMRTRPGAWTPPAPTAPPRPKKKRQPPAEEQMKILNMLEKGIISVEEAETLLKALEE